MGPLLFRLTIHMLSAKMRSEFVVFYLDDDTLRGNKEDIIHDIKNIEVETEALGLMRNRKKTEFICKDPTSREFVLGALPGVCIINPEDANLLGSPIGALQSVDACLKDKIELLRLMGDRLEHLQSHGAITLLCHSFAIPKMMHILCSAPRFSSSHLPSCNLLLKSILSNITNINF